MKWFYVGSALQVYLSYYYVVTYKISAILWFKPNSAIFCNLYQCCIALQRGGWVNIRPVAVVQGVIVSMISRQQSRTTTKNWTLHSRYYFVLWSKMTINLLRRGRNPSPLIPTAASWKWVHGGYLVNNMNNVSLSLSLSLIPTITHSPILAANSIKIEP